MNKYHKGLVEEHTRHEMKHSSVPRSGMFGKPNRPSTPIGGVISNQYGVAAEEEAEKIYATHLNVRTIKKKAPEIKRTKAADLKDSYTKTKKLGKITDPHQEKVNNFKIKRFNQVESRVRHEMGRTKN